AGHDAFVARKTRMPAQASLRSLRKLGCERWHEVGRRERAPLLKNIGELRLELACVGFDVVVVDRERLDLIEPRQSFRWRYVDAGREPPFLRKLALYVEQEVELSEQLGRVRVRRALDDRARRRDDDRADGRKDAGHIIRHLAFRIDAGVTR